MKRVVMAALLLMIIIIGCVFSYQKVDLLAQEMANQVLEANAMVEVEDEEAYAVLSESYGMWKQHQSLLGSLIHHDELDEVEVLFIKSLEYMKHNNKEEYFVESTQLHNTIVHLVETMQPIVKNIF